MQQGDPPINENWMVPDDQDLQEYLEEQKQENLELAHLYQNQCSEDLNDMRPQFYFESSAKSFYGDEGLNLQQKEDDIGLLPSDDITDYKLTQKQICISSTSSTFTCQQVREDFVINIEESTHYAEGSTHNGHSPQIQKISDGMIMNQQQQNKQELQQQQLQNISAQIKVPFKRNVDQLRKRGRPRKLQSVHEQGEEIFHYKCQFDPNLNSNQFQIQQEELGEINFKIQNSDEEIKDENAFQSQINKREKKRVNKKSKQLIQIPLVIHKKRGRKPKQLLNLEQPNIFDNQGNKFDFSKQQNKYDIDNMVSIPVYPGNGRRQFNNIDISSWTNKANIIVPESKLIKQESMRIEEPQNQKEDLLKSINFNNEEESEDEELTDDESYLIRHERAFADYMNQSFQLSLKKNQSKNYNSKTQKSFSQTPSVNHDIQNYQCNLSNKEEDQNLLIIQEDNQSISNQQDWYINELDQEQPMRGYSEEECSKHLDNIDDDLQCKQQSAYDYSSTHIKLYLPENGNPHFFDQEIDQNYKGSMEQQYELDIQ